MRHCANRLSVILPDNNIIQFIRIFAPYDLPTTDGRHLILTRYTQPEKDLRLLLAQLKLELPPQPRIQSSTAPRV